MSKIVVLLHIYFSKEQLFKKYFVTIVFTVTSSQCFDINKLLNSKNKKIKIYWPQTFER